MAYTTENTYTGNGSTKKYSFTFPYIAQADIFVTIEDSNGRPVPTTDWTFANATTIEFTTAPISGRTIRIYRKTNTDKPAVTFFSGTSIRAGDLNDNHRQLLFTAQESQDNVLLDTGGTITGDMVYVNADIVFEGTTNDEYQTTFGATDPTADQSYRLPNNSGGGDHTLISSGDSGTVTSSLLNSNLFISNLTVGSLTANSPISGNLAGNATGLDVTAVINSTNQTTTSPSDSKFYTSQAADDRFWRQDQAGNEIQLTNFTWSASDTAIATTGAIDARIINLVEEVGGFVPISSELQFPSTNPDINNGYGTVVSISTLTNDLVFDANGDATIANGAGPNVFVVITDGPASTTIEQGNGAIVETTPTTHTYKWHRTTPDVANVNTLANSITNINAVGNSIANVNTVAGNLTNINTVAGISSDVTTVAGVGTEVGRLGTADAVADMNTLGTAAIVADMDTLADIAADITTLAHIEDGTDATDAIQTVASNVNNITTILTDINDVSTVASNISDVTTVAGISSNVTTVAGISSDVTTVANNISSINTKLPLSGGTMTGDITFNSTQTFDGRDVSADGAVIDSLATVATSGSYNDLSNTPTIPTNNNQLTNGAGYTTFAEPGIFSGGGTPTLASGVTAAEVRTLIGAGTSSFSGSYNDLTNQPTIPTNNNQLTNGAGYITSFDITSQTDPKYIRSDATDIKTAGHTTFNNACSIKVGTNEDLEIYSTGSDVYFILDNSCDLHIQAGGVTRYKFDSTGDLELNDLALDGRFTTLSGNCGIGTAYPDSLLHLRTLSGGTDLLLESVAGTDNTITFNEGGTNFFRIRHAGSAGASPNNLFKIQTASTSNGIDGDAVTITQGGNVGIGTDPAYKLHVKSGNSNTAEVVAGFGNATIESGLQIDTNGNLDWGLNALNSRNLTFKTNQSERLRIDSNGVITHTGTFSSYNSSNDPGTNLKLGRSSAQYLTMHGGSSGNFITSVSSSTNPKPNIHLAVSVDGGATKSATYTLSGNSGTVWHTGNHGAGTGLDADTLDTLHASSFLRSDTHAGNSLFRVASGNGNGIRFWNGDVRYAMWMSDATNATYGGRLDSTSDYNIYFNIEAGTNRGFVFMNNNTPKFQIESTGQFRSEGGGIIDGALQTTNMVYSSNLDVPGLIFSTPGWTGANTNWNTFGYQFRLKSDSGGVGRMTIDVANSGTTYEALKVFTNGHVQTSRNLTVDENLTVIGTSEFNQQLSMTAPIEFDGTLNTYDAPGSPGYDTANDVAIALASGHRIVGQNTGYIRTLFEWNASSDIHIGQGSTSFIQGINLLPGSSGLAKVNGREIVTNTKFTSGANDGSTGAWHLTDSNITAYTDGMTVSLYMNNIAGVSTGTTFEINSLGAVDCYVSGNTRLTTHYGPNSLVMLYYVEASDRWYAHDYYYATDDYRIRWQNDVTAGSLVTGYQLLMEGVDGKMYPVTTPTASSTANTKPVQTAELRVNGLMLHYEYSADYAANATITTNHIYSSIYVTTMEYWHNYDAGWANSLRPWYIVCTKNSNGNFVLDNSSTTSFLTQTLPTSDDGKYYIMGGWMQNNHDAYRLQVDHPIYVYKNGGVVQWSQYAESSGSGGSSTTAGSVIETLAGMCDGRQVTVGSGTYTLDTANHSQFPSTTYEDLSGSEISYTPPSGTNQVIYDFEYQASYWSIAPPLWHTRFYIDSDEVTAARFSRYNYYDDRSRIRVILSLNNSTADIANGKLGTWTSAKTLKLQIRAYHGNYRPQVHKTHYFDGTSSEQNVVPTLTITAIA